MTHGSLFSGIGGFDLAAQWMGWENVFHCEWNEFGQKILKHYWPNAISYHDITKSTFTIHRGSIDILTGGFPCQPFSTAGQRKGTDDNRYLWPEMLRVIREVQPRYIVGENVRGLVNWNGGLVFDTVCADLEAEGYEVLPVLLPAASVNAPHRRDRVWFIAFKNTNENGWRSHKRKKQSEKWEQRNTCSGTDEPLSAYYDKNESFVDSNKSRGSDGLGQVQRADEGKFGNVTDPDKERFSTEMEDRELGRKQRFTISNKRNTWNTFPTVSPIHFGDDGLSDRLDGITFSKWRKESIKGAGNAIVPQIAFQIFKTIEQYDLGTEETEQHNYEK